MQHCLHPLKTGPEENHNLFLNINAIPVNKSFLLIHKKGREMSSLN
jgi:hypothetical protein